MTKFSETHPEFTGFSEFYAENILPDLDVKEHLRQQAVRDISIKTPLIVIAGGVVSIILWGLFSIVPLTLFTAGIFIVAAAGYAAHRTKDIQSVTKTYIVSGVCQFLGWTFQEKGFEPPTLEPLIDHGLLPRSYTRVNFEDKMSGEAHGTHFETLECHMEKKVKTKNGHRYVTVFRGALMAIEFHREFLGKTVVLRDKGFFNSRKKGALKRVGLVDPVFEKIFEAYSTDQVESRYLLTPDFMQKLVDVEHSVDGRNIRFAFLEGLLLVAVETPNRFEAGTMFTPLTDPTRTQKILDEVAAVYGLIDGIMEPYSARSSST